MKDTDDLFLDLIDNLFDELLKKLLTIVGLVLLRKFLIKMMMMMEEQQVIVLFDKKYMAKKTIPKKATEKK